MNDMVERVAKAIAENQDQGWLYNERAVAMLDPERLDKTRRKLHAAARAAIEATNYATLETALLTIIKSMNEYLPPSGGDKDKFINEVIGAVDNGIVAKALEVRK